MTASPLPVSNVPRAPNESRRSLMDVSFFSRIPSV
jgi:hypothetical protein